MNSDKMPSGSGNTAYSVPGTFEVLVNNIVVETTDLTKGSSASFLNATVKVMNGATLINPSSTVALGSNQAIAVQYKGTVIQSTLGLHNTIFTTYTGSMNANVTETFKAAALQSTPPPTQTTGNPAVPSNLLYILGGTAISIVGVIALYEVIKHHAGLRIAFNETVTDATDFYYKSQWKLGYYVEKALEGTAKVADDLQAKIMSAARGAWKGLGPVVRKEEHAPGLSPTYMSVKSSFAPIKVSVGY